MKEEQIKQALEAEMDVSFEVEKVESMETKNEKDLSLRTVANELLARIRHEAASGRWSSLNPNDFNIRSYFQDAGNAVGLIYRGLIPHTISLYLEVNRWDIVYGECVVVYGNNLFIESGPLEAVSRFYYNSTCDHLESFLRKKQDELNAAFGSNVWHIERCEPRSIYDDCLSLAGPKLSPDAAYDAFCRLLDVMLHEPRCAQPILFNNSAVNDYTECVDGEEKELVQAYAHYIRLLINYELKRTWIDDELCPF